MVISAKVCKNFKLGRSVWRFYLVFLSPGSHVRLLLSKSSQFLMVHCIQLDTKRKWHKIILYCGLFVIHNKCWWVLCAHLEQFACSHTISHPNAAWSALSAVAGLQQKEAMICSCIQNRFSLNFFLYFHHSPQQWGPSCQASDLQAWPGRRGCPPRPRGCPCATYSIQ